MAIKKIPCGGFRYDDETVEFVDGVMKAKGASKEVTNAIETGGLGWTESEFKEGFDIAWDGNTEGLERTVDGERVKISDLDIPNDQIVGLKYDGSFLDTHEVYETYEVTSEEFEQLTEMGDINDDYADIGAWIIVHTNGIIVEDTEYPHKGIYANDPEYVELYISRIYKEASTEEVVHQIDQKYIPSGGSGGISLYDVVARFSFDESGENIVCDKTYEELVSAFESGKAIAGIINEGGLSLTFEFPRQMSDETGPFMQFETDVSSIRPAEQAVKVSNIELCVRDNGTITFDVLEVELPFSE